MRGPVRGGHGPWQQEGEHWGFKQGVWSLVEVRAAEGCVLGPRVRQRAQAAHWCIGFSTAFVLCVSLRPFQLLRDREDDSYGLG